MHILYPAELEAPPAADRLRAMIRALAAGAEIDAAMRAEIIDALKRHEVRRENDRTRSTKGRGIEYPVWWAAAIAKELIDRHGAKPKTAAIRAAAKSVRWQQGLDASQRIPGNEIAAITRAYQKLDAAPGGRVTTKAGAFEIAHITPSFIEDALARFNKSESTVSRSNCNIATAVLFDPIGGD